MTAPASEGRAKSKSKQPLGVRLACIAGFAVLIVAMTISGVMTLAREYVSGDHVGIKADGSIGYKESGYEVVSADLVEITEWIKANTEPDATFLTATNHNNAIAMLTGRDIVCGSSSFLYYHGLDYQERYENVRRMYESPVEYYGRYVEEYDVDYVLLSSWEMYNYSIDFGFFRALEPVCTAGDVTLYKAR